ncbi:hypothetical protein CURTO8I2_170128 [Curtobacterium sp. 8I-2]|nr:hypothetical protein CURTO8I2_170128 [Curtobacterium sp. 8I-2]
MPQDLRRWMTSWRHPSDAREGLIRPDGLRAVPHSTAPAVRASRTSTAPGGASVPHEHRTRRCEHSARPLS